jgi:hypothetical protein
VACCGKQASVAVNDPVVMSSKVRGGLTTTSLSNSLGEPIDEKNWIWKQYQGLKQGSFAKISRVTQIQYMIQGNGHTFPIHKKDEAIFRGTVRDKFPTVPDPRTQEPEPEPDIQIEVAPTITEIPKPEMSTIIRMDSVALEVAEPDIQEVIIEPNPPAFVSDTIGSSYPSPGEDFSLSSLKRSKSQMRWHLLDLNISEGLTDLLNENKWTVELLAIAKPSKLTALSGIGIKRAQSIIAKAKELIK